MPHSRTSERSSPSIDPTLILFIVTLVGGMIFAIHSPESHRPQSPKGGLSNTELSEQRNDTRLWDDPFGVLERKPDSGWAGFLPEDVAHHALKANSSELLILPVMVPAGPSSEDKEQRRRMRYAVVSALSEEEFEPDRPSEIGIWSIDGWKPTLDVPDKTLRCPPDSRTNGSRANYAAFEWYTQNNAQPGRRALLLWLDEDAFADNRAYSRLGDILKKLRRDSPKSAAHCPIKTAFLAPYYSSTLRLIYDDSLTTTNLDIQDTSLFLFSPRASDRYISSSVEENQLDSPGRQKIISELKRKRSFSDVFNYVHTDTDLARAVDSELQERGIKLANKDCSEADTDHLVLIVDRDTYAGRKMFDAYKSMIRQRMDGQNPKNLHTYNYLSGLDGVETRGSAGIAGDNPGRNGTENPISKTGFTSNPDPNRAEGSHQIDYLVRLSESIERLEGSLVKEKRGHIRAIGIHGADLYDTLIILQALRPQFRDTIFFTTDLDARLFSPIEHKWTHNLLVISSYGLRLADEFQSHTPEFRDSRQTALFAAMRAALGNERLRTFGTNPNPPAPRLFEIGRFGPRELVASSHSFDGTDDTRRWGPHPNPPHLWFSWNWRRCLISSGIVFFVSTLVVCLSPAFRTVLLERNSYLASLRCLDEADIGGFRGVWCLQEAVARKFYKGLPIDRKSGLLKMLNVTLNRIGNQAPSIRDLEFKPNEMLRPREIARLLFISNDEAVVFIKSVILDCVSRIGLQVKLPIQLANGELLFIDKMSDDHVGFELSIMLNAVLGDNRALDNVFLRDYSGHLLIIEKIESDEKRDGKKRLSPTIWNLLRRMDTLENEWMINNGSIRVLLRLMCQDLFAPHIRTILMPQIYQKTVQMVLEEINRILMLLDPDKAVLVSATSGVGRQALRQISVNRGELNRHLDSGNTAPGGQTSSAPPVGGPDVLEEVSKRASAARFSAERIYRYAEIRIQIAPFVLGICAFLAIVGVYLINPGGPGGSWKSVIGISPWPTIGMCVLAGILALYLGLDSYRRLSEAILSASRKYRLPFGASVDPVEPVEGQSRSILSDLRKKFWKWYRCVELPVQTDNGQEVIADDLWRDFQTKLSPGSMLFRTFWLLTPYLVLVTLVLLAFTGEAWYFPRLRGEVTRGWYFWTMAPSFLLFLVLTFWTIDYSRICGWLISRISHGPTTYSDATLRYFSDERGHIDSSDLSEYIDVKIVAEMSSRAGSLLYFPCIVFCLILLAHNTVTYGGWNWGPLWYGLCICHICFASTSVVILQRAASRARDKSVAALEMKLKQKRFALAATVREKEDAFLAGAEVLLQEMQELESKGFSDLRGNPVIGALLVPSGAAVAVQFIQYLLG